MSNVDELRNRLDGTYLNKLWLALTAVIVRVCMQRDNPKGAYNWRLSFTVRVDITNKWLALNRVF